MADRKNERKEKGIVLISELSLVILGMLLSGIMPASGSKWLGTWANLFPLAAVFLGGIPVLVEVVKAATKKQMNADLLFIVALSATTFIGGENHVVAATLVLMMGIGEFVEAWTLDTTYEHASKLLDVEPERVQIIKQDTSNSNLSHDGSIKEILITEIKTGDIYIIRAGERVPVDGKICRGDGEVDASVITGEPIPEARHAGGTVLAGMLVVEGAFEVEASAARDDSSLARIKAMIEEARNSKSPIQSITDRWASYFAPIVILIATGTWLLTQNIFYTISVLLVACPCALAISVPTAFIGALGNAARKGIWFKSGKTIEDAGRTNMLVLDKTGTLTAGLPAITAITPRSGTGREELERIIYSIEARSTHPIAKSITTKLLHHQQDPLNVVGFSIMPGMGVEARLENIGRVFIGNDELLFKEGPTPAMEDAGGNTPSETVQPHLLHVFTPERMLGTIEFGDQERKGLKAAIKGIRREGVSHVVLMTGDAEQPAQQMGKTIGADLVYPRATPADKASFIKEARMHGAIVAMAGDGINDAPALALADVGIAMGKEGTALAVHQANVVVMDDDITKILDVISLGKKCVGKARTNIALSIMFNVVGISLSALGYIVPIGAALFHVIQSLTVVGNAALLLRRGH